MASKFSEGRSYRNSNRIQSNYRSSSSGNFAGTSGTSSRDRKKKNGSGRVSFTQQRLEREETGNENRKGSVNSVRKKTGFRQTASGSSSNRRPYRSSGNTYAKNGKKTGRVTFRERVEARERTIPIKSHAMDYKILFLVLFLFGFGLVMIYSASSYNASLYENDALFYVKSQVKSGAMGIVLMLVISMIPYQKIRDWRWISIVLYLGTLALLGVTLAGGSSANGSTRWFSIGGMSFQPSEVAKMAMILILASFIEYYTDEMRHWRGVMGAFLFAVPILVLVGIENLSTAIILLGIVLIMIFVATPLILPFAVILLAGIAGAAGLIIVAPYRFERIHTWMNLYSSDNGLQTLQGLYAIGSGGFFGKGLGQSMQKMGFVPESHNDMIFSIICEELGLFGAICVILLFILLIVRIVNVVRNAPDIYGSMIGVGVIAHIGLQAFVNIGVVTNTIPNTGVPLPFISYGGTSLLILMMETGTVLSVSRYIRIRDHRKAGDL